MDIDISHAGMDTGMISISKTDTDTDNCQYLIFFSFRISAYHSLKSALLHFSKTPPTSISPSPGESPSLPPPPPSLGPTAALSFIFQHVRFIYLPCHCWHSLVPFSFHIVLSPGPRTTIFMAIASPPTVEGRFEFLWKRVPASTTKLIYILKDRDSVKLGPVMGKVFSIERIEESEQWYILI